AEQKKVKTALGRALLAFAAKHGTSTVRSFRLAAPDQTTWQPKTPFKPPAGATPEALVDTLMQHFNAFSNDNRSGPGPDGVTRFAAGPREAKGGVAALAPLPAATAKATLRALSKRILMADDRGRGFKPRRIWIDPKAVPLVEKLAAKLGVKASFRGDP